MDEEFWIGLIMAVVMVLVFSFAPIPIVELPTWGESRMGIPGNSGMVLPGKGSEPADVVMPEPRCEPDPEVSTSESPPVQTVEVINETENIKGEIPMDDMLVSFWCGVAAVLLGETSALMVVIAVLMAKIKGDRKV